MKLLAQGAESKLFLEKNRVIKDRFRKTYRIKEIDDRLRKSRTKREAKILDKLQKINFPVPALIYNNEIYNNNIIHHDLTTSNMISKKDKIFFIDFGLSFFSTKIEDRAVDLHLLKEALESK